MALIDFTSYDDIRAALGVSSEEIEDTTLSLPLYELNLAAELEGVGETLVDLFKALPPDLLSWSPAERRLDRWTRLFATYSVARQLLGALPLFAPKEISDGKATEVRFALDPYKATTKTVLEQWAAARTKLAETLAEATSTSTVAAPRQFLMAVSPTYDPVLGA